MQEKDLFDIMILASTIVLMTVLYIGIGIYVSWFVL